jgi:hypothetical protein
MVPVKMRLMLIGVFLALLAAMSAYGPIWP